MIIKFHYILGGMNLSGVAKIAEKRRRDTREKIIRTGRDLFSKKGYHNTQVMDIVNEIGMSAGTFYNYFKDKRQLFLEITKDNFENLRIRLKELRQISDPKNVKERIDRYRETFNAFFDFVDENPEQILMILRGGFGVDEELDEGIWRELSLSAADLAENFQVWIDLGISSAYNTLIAGHATVGMTFQIAHSYLIEKRFSREEAVEFLVQTSTYSTYGFLTEKGRKLLDDV
jgi:AcrR family transcriptional regulator